MLCRMIIINRYFFQFFGLSRRAQKDSFQCLEDLSNFLNYSLTIGYLVLITRQTSVIVCIDNISILRLLFPLEFQVKMHCIECVRMVFTQIWISSQNMYQFTILICTSISAIQHYNEMEISNTCLTVDQQIRLKIFSGAPLETIGVFNILCKYIVPKVSYNIKLHIYDIYNSK